MVEFFPGMGKGVTLTSSMKQQSLLGGDCSAQQSNTQALLQYERSREMGLAVPRPEHPKACRVPSGGIRSSLWDGIAGEAVCLPEPEH